LVLIAEVELKRAGNLNKKINMKRRERRRFLKLAGLFFNKNKFYKTNKIVRLVLVAGIRFF